MDKLKRERYIKFEGEYLNGKINGNRKEYYYDGKLKFEGKYLNGERNGNGKIYDNDGKLIFDGEYLNGEKIIKLNLNDEN